MSDGECSNHIEGVVLQDLRCIPTPGGPVLHMLRADSPLFRSFGEVYFSEVEPRCVKAWKRHSRQTQHFSVPVGRLKVVLYDDRPDSSTHGVLQEIELGRPDAYRLLRIPPQVWYGFTALGEVPALICNCVDLPHDPAESERIAVDSSVIPYSW